MGECILRGRWSEAFENRPMPPLPNRLARGEQRVACFCGEDTPDNPYVSCLGCARMKLTPDEEAERQALWVMHRYAGEITREDYLKLCELDGKAADMYIVMQEIEGNRFRVDVSPDWAVFGFPEDWKKTVDETGAFDTEHNGRTVMITKEGIWKEKNGS